MLIQSANNEGVALFQSRQENIMEAYNLSERRNNYKRYFKVTKLK